MKIHRKLIIIVKPQYHNTRSIKLNKLVFGLLLVIVNISNAKIISSIGAQIGLNSTFQSWNYKPDDIDVMDNVDLHYNAVFSVEMFKVNHLNLFLSISYLQKGGLDNDVIETDALGRELGTISDWTRLDYICISPALRFNYRINKIDPYLIIGPSFDLMVLKEESFDKNITDQFNEFEISLPFGVGCEYNLINNINLNLNIQFQPSITNLFKNNSLTVKNNLFKYDFGLLFQI